ncbi:hypothetical protein ES705_13474 [subsurface metagenome]
MDRCGSRGEAVSKPSEGFEAFKEVTNSVRMNPKFKATHYEVKDLKISFSGNGYVAWFYCLPDDFGECDGKKTGWENVRWFQIYAHSVFLRGHYLRHWRCISVSAYS